MPFKPRGARVLVVVAVERVTWTVRRGEVVLCAFSLLLVAGGLCFTVWFAPSLPAGDCALALTVHMALVLLAVAGAPLIAVEVYERYFEDC